MAGLKLETAVRVIDAALARASELGCAPPTVVVLDAGGHEIALKRQDGSGILRADIARGKAWGSLGMGFPSRELAERQKVPHFFGALAAVSRGRLVPAAGGDLIYDQARNVVGAVGISGDTLRFYTPSANTRHYEVAPKFGRTAPLASPARDVKAGR